MALAESASRVELAPSRESFSHIPEVLPLPNLIQTQTVSFHWFVKSGLRELLDEITPITDFTGKNLELHFRDFYFEEAKYSEEECRTRDLTYSRPLKVEVDLVIKETDEVKHQTVFMGDFPWMTEQGTFIINGAERVVVSQLVRSPGVYYTEAEDPSTGRKLYAAKVIPNRGAWLEFETSNKDLLSVKVDRKRKIPVTTLLRAVDISDNAEMLRLFAAVDDNPEHPYMSLTLDKDTTSTQDEALIEVYKKLRPGDPPTVDNARALVTSLFFNFRRYDLGRVGRYKLNKALGDVAKKLKIELPPEETENPRDSRVISKNDIVSIVGKLIELNNGRGEPDDIDHLGNRRIRANGELIQNQF
ncbi:MAG: DNA-directed RNA polymerase subunit beta, partial [Chloroflexota bacterium]